MKMKRVLVCAAIMTCIGLPSLGFADDECNPDPNHPLVCGDNGARLPSQIQDLDFSNVYFGNIDALVFGGVAGVGNAPAPPPGGNGVCGFLPVCGPGNGQSVSGGRLVDLDSAVGSSSLSASFKLSGGAQSDLPEVDRVPFLLLNFHRLPGSGAGKVAIYLSTEFGADGEVVLKSATHVTLNGVTNSTYQVVPVGEFVPVSIDLVWDGGSNRFAIKAGNKFLVYFGAVMAASKGDWFAPDGRVDLTQFAPGYISYGNLGASGFTTVDGEWRPLIYLADFRISGKTGQ